MTFKHIDFSSSETMRSLERLAIEKGLVKPVPMKKEAAAKPVDLVPTDNLMQNVLKLCAGLVASGFVKEAKELESNFLAYKQAQTLYETSKEEGKDLIEAAHPQGSHKMSNMDADEAVVEDILDKHKKLMTIMDKTPTGKLASAKDIIDAIKVATGARSLALNGGKKALAQGYVFFGEYIGTIAQIGAAGNRVLSAMESMSGSFDGRDEEYVQQFAESLAEVKRLWPDQQQLIENPSEDDVVALRNFSNVLDKSMTSARNIWNSATAHINAQFLGRARGFSSVPAHAQNYIDAANKIYGAIIHASREIRKQIDEQVKASGGGTTLMTDYQTARDTIELYKAKINARRPLNAAKMIVWLDSMKTYIKEEADEFNKVAPKFKQEVATEYVKRMEGVKERLAEFGKEIPQ